jgi:hypothetical protein
MSEVIFNHSKTGRLVIPIGMNGISWAYVLNTASFNTYGGEVVQILSCYIDALTIEGDVKRYKDAEEVYEFFAKYFTAATQGASAEHQGQQGVFEQEPMTLEYPDRGWTFWIQPMSAPGFLYGNEVVVPKWRMKAWIVDRGLNNEELKRYVGEFAQKQIAELGGRFNLTGELSPVSGDPANNPFIAPLVPKVSEPNSKGQITFEPVKAEEVMTNVGHLADFYTSLIPSYLKGDFADVTQVSGSSPIFGQPGSPTTEESAAQKKNVEQTTHGSIK